MRGPSPRRRPAKRQPPSPAYNSPGRVSHEKNEPIMPIVTEGVSVRENPQVLNTRAKALHASAIRSSKRHDHRISPGSVSEKQEDSKAVTCPIEQHLAFRGATSTSRAISNKYKTRSSNQKSRSRQQNSFLNSLSRGLSNTSNITSNTMTSNTTSNTTSNRDSKTFNGLPPTYPQQSQNSNSTQFNQGIHRSSSRVRPPPKKLLLEDVTSSGSDSETESEDEGVNNELLSVNVKNGHVMNSTFTMKPSDLQTLSMLISPTNKSSVQKEQNSSSPTNLLNVGSHTEFRI